MIGDSEKMKCEAIVFMFDGLTGRWKCSIGYYLIDGESAAILCQMMKLAFQLLADGDSNCLFLNFKIMSRFFQDHGIDRDTYGAGVTCFGQYADSRGKRWD